MTPDATLDDRFLRHAIHLAMNGRGRVEPNPMVGCVLVRNDAIIGEGYHTHFGGPHAEPAALADCHTRGNDPAGSTAYVTLEPCCHTNKKTPPCVPALIAAKVARVVIGTLDPNDQVNGRGIALLRAAGIDVSLPASATHPVERAGEWLKIPSVDFPHSPVHIATECRQLIAPFLLATTNGRPYVTLKWALSLDGKIAGPGGRRAAISNVMSNRVVHALRGRCDALVVGANTVRIDDPSLTVRHAKAAHTPVRVVIDRGLNIRDDRVVIRTARDVPTIVITRDDADVCRIEQLRRQGVHVQLVVDEGMAVIDAALSAPRFLGLPCTHVLVEPGPTLARTLIESNRWDRTWTIRGDVQLDDDTGTAPDAPRLPSEAVRTDAVELDNDLLVEYLNPTSAAFHAPVSSADFVLANAFA